MTNVKETESMKLTSAESLLVWFGDSSDVYRGGRIWKGCEEKGVEGKEDKSQIEERKER